jgi:membrane protease YdiL (CAAX protease family)
MFEPEKNENLNDLLGNNPENQESSMPTPPITPIVPDRSIRALGDAVGFPLCMFFIINYVLEYVIVCAVLIFSAVFNNSAFESFSDPNVQYVLSGMISLVSLTVPYLYTLKATKSTFSELISVKRVASSKLIALVMLGFGASALSNLASNILESVVNSFFGIQFENPAPEYGSDAWSFILMLLCVGILPALLEEFAIRGVVLGALRKKFSDTSAIVISSVLFGIMHGNLQQIPFATLLGLLLAYTTIYTGSLLPAIVIHAVNNTMSVILAFSSQNMSPMVSIMTSYIYFTVSLIIGICGFIMLIKSDSDAFKLSTERAEETKPNLRQFVSSPWIIIFIVLCAIQVLLAQGVITLG